ncbi:MAG TPA: alpha/beta fold hydrolase [Dehalococcoidia bacterium]|nr:alpha/beta fold hydrolase [Dehalococcoidia bacterium]
MSTVEAAAIACGKLRLQATVHNPAGEPRGAVVICHPHPLYGGDMDNHVVAALAEALAAGGLAALRFNFRGVGRSQGQHDNGNGERQDVLAALAAAQELLPAGGKVGLAGYSFGAVMSAAVAAQAESLGALALISPPAAAPPVQALDAPGIPKLIVAGSEDPIAPAAELEKIVASSRAELIVVPGVDHSWFPGFDEMAAHIAQWFAKSLAA